MPELSIVFGIVIIFIEKNPSVRVFTLGTLSIHMEHRTGRNLAEPGLRSKIYLYISRTSFRCIFLIWRISNLSGIVQMDATDCS